MRVHIVNPSHFSYGTGFITPRWMFVLAAATPAKWGDPILSDESLEQFDTDRLEKGDVIGIGLHTGNALVGYALGRRARERGAYRWHILAYGPDEQVTPLLAVPHRGWTVDVDPVDLV